MLVHYLEKYSSIGVEANIWASDVRTDDESWEKEETAWHLYCDSYKNCHLRADSPWNIEHDACSLNDAYSVRGVLKK